MNNCVAIQKSQLNHVTWLIVQTLDAGSDGCDGGDGGGGDHMDTGSQGSIIKADDSAQCYQCFRSLNKNLGYVTVDIVPRPL